MSKNIAVTAFTSNGKTIKPMCGGQITHIQLGAKTHHVPNGLKEPLRQLKSMGGEFAYVVCCVGQKIEKMLVPTRDAQILMNQLN